MFTHRQRATVKALLSEWTEVYTVLPWLYGRPPFFLVALLTHSNIKQNGSGCDDFST